MSAPFTGALLVGLLAFGLGLRVLLWPVSERIVDDVASEIEASSGEPPARSEVRKSITRDRRRLGATAMVAGAAIVVIALLLG